MSRIRTTILLQLFLFGTPVLFAQKADPYHKKSGGFGYQLEKNNTATIWWCEGAFKIMKDTPIPGKKGKSIELFSAKNEYEPFQLVINPADTLEEVLVSIDKLVGPYGEIANSMSEIRKVEYVNITRPSDSYGYSGLWPDPLPEVTTPLRVNPGTNTSFWINIYIPESSMPGVYSSTLTVSCDKWVKRFPVKITVWDFTLPRKPSIRSGFGLSVDKISDYHNVKDTSDLKEVFDLYMKSFQRYRIAPYSFYYLYPFRKTITGLDWEGGYYDSIVKCKGRYSYRIEDNSPTEALKGSTRELIPVEDNSQYMLKWDSKASVQGQQFVVLIEGYDADGNLLVFENKTQSFTCDTIWKSYNYNTGEPGPGVKKVRINLYPAFRTAEGEHTGTLWFDNISLAPVNPSGPNTGLWDFEVISDSIGVSVDFSDFDLAASRYIDEFGFNSFRLNLEGLGGGTYYSRHMGEFEGFMQGSSEYGHLMSDYLSLIQDHLAEKGWLGREYIYWFDEPGQKDYPFVREGMQIIKNAAPRLRTFITENEPGPEIMDVTDITCTIFNRVDPSTVNKVIAGGGEYWSYLCTGPKSPWITEFIDHDAINLRIWLWMSYSYRLSGILIWSTNYWTSYSASPPGYLQNPWLHPESFVQGYGWPLGKQTNWGNGDGRLWYPPNRSPNTDRRSYMEGPVPSLRIEFLRQGIEDYEYFKILEGLADEEHCSDQNLLKKSRKLLQIPGSIFRDGKTYTKDPRDLYKYRHKVAEMILRIKQ